MMKIYTERKVNLEQDAKVIKETREIDRLGKKGRKRTKRTVKLKEMRK